MREAEASQMHADKLHGSGVAMEIHASNIGYSTGERQILVDNAYERQKGNCAAKHG